MLEMASFLKYVDMYLTSEWGRFYVGHPVYRLCPSGQRYTVQRTSNLLLGNTDPCQVGKKQYCAVYRAADL
jgi:hypothetical protein